MQKQTTMSQSDIQEDHASLFDEVSASIGTGYEIMIAILRNRKVELLAELETMRVKQTAILAEKKEEETTDYVETAKLVRSNVKDFLDNVGKLDHIKLSLARGQAFVLPEGRMNNLITSSSSSEVSLPRMNCDELPVTQYNRLLANLTKLLEEERKVPVLPSLRKRMEISLPQTSLFSQVPSEINGLTCFVFYLPPNIDDDGLKALFNPYGKIINAYVAMDKVSNKSRCFGFVDFSLHSEALAAIAALDKKAYGGKFLSVSIKV